MVRRYSRRFFHAVEHGDIATVRWYLTQQVDLNRRDNYGNTPLMLACTAGNCRTVRILLDAGADCQHVNHQGETALALAAQEAHPRLVRLLLHHGARWENTKAGNRRALALLNPHENSIIKTDLYAWIDDHDRKEPTVRLNRVKRLLQEVISLLATAGADVNIPGREGLTPLMYCCTHDYRLAVQKLLLHGADPNLKNLCHGSHQWPLKEAVLLQHDDCARMLLDAGADPNVADETGKTALMVAAYIGSWKMSLLLIGHGADVTMRDHVGWDALHHAVSHNGCRKELLDALMSAGAGLDVADTNGFTPIDRYLAKTVSGNADGTLLPLDHQHLAFLTAARNGDAARLAAFDGYAIPRRLLTHALAGCAFEGQDECCRLLIQMGADQNGFSILGSAPLVVAASMLRLSTVELLVSHGADPNSKNSAGQSALIALCQYLPDTHTDSATPDKMSQTACQLARFLLEHGADPNSTGTYNITPLRQVVLNSADLSLAWLLLAYGADAQIMDDDGKTALEHAEHYCCQEMVDLLRTAARLKAFS